MHAHHFGRHVGVNPDPPTVYGDAGLCGGTVSADESRSGLQLLFSRKDQTAAVLISIDAYQFARGYLFARQ
jgi:hypothetical protein